MVGNTAAMGNQPTVSGPIEGGRRGIAFCTPRTDLAARGYVVEEFLLDGEALSYLPAPGVVHGHDGRWDSVESEKASFRTTYPRRPSRTRRGLRRDCRLQLAERHRRV